MIEVKTEMFNVLTKFELKAAQNNSSTNLAIPQLTPTYSSPSTVLSPDANSNSIEFQIVDVHRAPTSASGQAIEIYTPATLLSLHDSNSRNIKLPSSVHIHTNEETMDGNLGSGNMINFTTYTLNDNIR